MILKRKPIKRHIVILGLLGLLFLVSGCAQPTLDRPGVSESDVQSEKYRQQKQLVKQTIKQNRRLVRVSTGLNRAAVPLCEKDINRISGFAYKHLGFVKQEFKRVFREVTKVGNRLQITQVVDGTPADKAGLKEGDIIKSINGWNPPKSPPENTFGIQMGPEDFQEHISTKLDELTEEGESRTFKINRKGRDKTFKVRSVQTCNYNIKLLNKSSINAVANGSEVGVTKGMMRFVDSDTELSIVVAHEIAHNALNHIQKQQQNQLMGTFLGALIDAAAASQGVYTGGAGAQAGASAGALSFSKEFEAEADYAGLYIMARADLSINQAPSFWRKMATANPGSNNQGVNATHPTSAFRFKQLEQTIKEIQKKRKRKEPLLPEKKQYEPEDAEN